MCIDTIIYELRREMSCYFERKIHNSTIFISSMHGLSILAYNSTNSFMKCKGRYEILHITKHRRKVHYLKSFER